MPDTLSHQPPFEIFEADVQREVDERIREGQEIIEAGYAGYIIELGGTATRACDTFGYARPGDETLRHSE